MYLLFLSIQWKPMDSNGVWFPNFFTISIYVPQKKKSDRFGTTQGWENDNFHFWVEHSFHSRAVCRFQTVNPYRMRHPWLFVSEKPLHQRPIHALTSAKARRSCTLRTPSCLTTFLAPSATAASIFRWCLSSSSRSSSGLIVSEGRPAQKPAFSKNKTPSHQSSTWWLHVYKPYKPAAFRITKLNKIGNNQAAIFITVLWFIE